MTVAQESTIPPGVAALMLRQRHGLSGDAEVTSLHPAMLEHIGRRLPGNRGGNDDAKSANGSCVTDADETATAVEEGSSCEALMHRRSRPEDLVNRAARAGAKWSADNGDDARACRYSVAPGSRHGQPDVPDAHRSNQWRDERRVERRRSQHRDAGRWIPAE